MSEEQKKKISDSVKMQHAEGRGNSSGLSSKGREKAWALLRGRKLTQEHKDKLSLAKLGKKHTDEQRKKNSEAHKGLRHNGYLRGDKHPAWQGGLTPIAMKIRNSTEMKNWRKAVFERDDYTCQFCSKRGVYIEADHIKPFSLFPELRFVLSNGRILCRPCHDNTKMSLKKMRELYGNDLLREVKTETI